MRIFPEGDAQRSVWDACESPIEQILCTALFTFLGCKAVHGTFNNSRLAQMADEAGAIPACFLFAQHKIGPYRADFLLVTVDPNRRTHRAIIIECDGKEFHKSEKHMVRDKTRDEAIEQAGYRVIRYPGKAIHGRMPEITAEVKRWIEAGGATCEPDANMESFARLLSNVTPDRSAKAERQKARDAYWQEEERQASRPDFVMDNGASGYWRDTL